MHRRPRAAVLLLTGLLVTGCTAAAPARPPAGGDATTAASASTAPDTAPAAPDTAPAAPDTPTGPPTPGALTAGDPYVPGLGNGGYDATDYRIALTYDAAGHGIATATATIGATATQHLSRFSLDLHALTVDAVQVDGRRATWSHRADKLVVTPDAPLPAGRAFQVEVRYHGTPRPVLERQESMGVGWQRTPDGAVVLSEAGGARTWFPVNDRLADKARYTFVLTVPSALHAVANGMPTGDVVRGGLRTQTWRVDAPMTPYVATVAIGRLVVVRSTGPHGLPIISAMPKELVPRWRAVLPFYERMLTVLEKNFGPYPFESAGAVFVPGNPWPRALETQSRTTYATFELGLGELRAILLHETAHQWFADSVTPATWRDIWLNEGFASLAETLWSEQTGQRLSMLDGVCAPPGPVGSVAAPTPDALFEAALVYERGRDVLLELRRLVGAEAFGALLLRWTAEHRHGVASTEDFERLAATVTGRDLDDFFARELHTPPRFTGPRC